ncbi:MAG: nickel pincer cofactor biosynthesis protein LarC [Chlorobi bacterium]|nr:nickel pincer cofactor biosynthesis protein LarC [Chlorobiota bacterium]
MQILYYHCFSGISGDMNLGAMADLGIPETYLQEIIARLNLPGVELVFEKDSRNSIFGTKATVKISGNTTHHRTLKNIEKMIRDAEFSDEITTTALDIFQHLAEAEADIHHKTPDTIHFHEVGGEDAIVDIVGAAAAYHYLHPDEVWTSVVELGNGLVKTAHGTMPVPAPATAALLKDTPVHIGGTDMEATTPTGAAILKTLTTRYVSDPLFIIKKTGYGIGHTISEIRPNLLRVHLAEIPRNKPSFHTSEADILECNLDDMNPEWFEHIMDALFKAGAADVTLTPVVMKKNRPGMVISVLSPVNKSQMLGEVLLRETTSLGYRRYRVEKSFLDRRIITLETSLGKVNIKESYFGDQVFTRKPEYEDCRRIAQAKGMPLKKVYERIWEEISKIK